MYAIIQQGGHQYKVKPGMEIKFDRLFAKEGDKVVFKEVLLLVDNSSVAIGQPYVANSSVTLKVIKHFQGDKVRVTRFKAKSRYTRVKGFRPQISLVRVEKISKPS